MLIAELTNQSRIFVTIFVSCWQLKADAYKLREPILRLVVI